VKSEWIKQGKKRKAVNVGLKIYYENGHVEREILSGDGNKFFANKTSTRKEYYENGQLKATGNAYSIVLCEVGEWKYYYPDGTLESTGNFDGGAKTGVWKYYYPNGQLKQTGMYKTTRYRFNSGDICERKVNMLDDKAMSYLIQTLGSREQVSQLQIANSSDLGCSTLGVFGCSSETGEWKYYNEDGELIKTESF